MSFSPVEEILADIRAGKMVIIVDDEDRENEGDLICAAEKISPEIINFMATPWPGIDLRTYPAGSSDEIRTSIDGPPEHGVSGHQLYGSC